MNEDACQIVSTKSIVSNKPNWQMIAIIAGVVLVLITLFYFFYKFIHHTNTKFKTLENAIHSLNERSKQNVVHHAQPPQPPPSHPMYMQQMKPSIIQPPPIIQQQQPIIVDTKVLDKELMEELKELTVPDEKGEPEPEGRVDNTTPTEEEKTNV